MPQAPAFWFTPRPGLAALALGPLSLVYGAASAAHAWVRGLRPYYASVPVISAGNLTVGGSGKTPLVAALAHYFARQGQAVAVVACGYGAREARWPVRVDIFTHTARQVGDEALMLAQALRHESVAVWVAANKRDAVRRAEEAGASLIIIDDAFHRRDIARDADIVVVDGPRGFGNGLLLPAGPLREPKGNIARASFAVVMNEPAERANTWYGVTAYRLKLVPDAAEMAILQGQPLVAFAGLGNPDKFFAMLKAQGLQLAAEVGYPDHHAYRARDLDELDDLAQRHNARLVTTAKDAAKLPAGFAAVVNVQAKGADWQPLLADLLPRLDN